MFASALMPILSLSLSLLSLTVRPTVGFAATAVSSGRPRTSPLSVAGSNAESQRPQALQPGDAVMLVGPSFLQLVIAKHCKLAGLRPIVVAPQKKLDSFFENLLVDESEIERDSTIGMPEQGDPYFGELKGVVFCAEDAILPPDFVDRVLDFTDGGQSAFAGGGDGSAGPTRVVCCLPLEGKQQKEKSSGWIPIFNNDRTTEQNWKNFADSFKEHPVWTSTPNRGTIVRFGSLFGGSIDGPEFLRRYGLDEGMYKMSLEQYRDLRERSFDRYRLGAQVLAGNAINNKPPNQKKMEDQALKPLSGEVRETFAILGGYPEVDRANRHTVAAAVVQSLMQPSSVKVPQEMTVLSKAVSELPSPDEWKEMFENPGPAKWPDPFTFRPAEYGVESKQE